MDSWTIAGNIHELIKAATSVGSRGSFVTRTRLQKFAYLVEHLFHIPLGLEPRLSYYGPYASELASATDLLKQYHAIDEKGDEAGYRIELGEDCPLFVASPDLSPEALKKVLRRLVGFNTHELILMATAHFIETHSKVRPMDDEILANEVQEIKPHYDRSMILAAIGELRKLQESRQPTP